MSKKQNNRSIIFHGFLLLFVVYRGSHRSWRWPKPPAFVSPFRRRFWDGQKTPITIVSLSVSHKNPTPEASSCSPTKMKPGELLISNFSRLLKNKKKPKKILIGGKNDDLIDRRHFFLILKNENISSFISGGCWRPRWGWTRRANSYGWAVTLGEPNCIRYAIKSLQLKEPLPSCPKDPHWPVNTYDDVVLPPPFPFLFYVYTLNDDVILQNPSREMRVYFYLTIHSTNSSVLTFFSN